MQLGRGQDLFLLWTRLPACPRTGRARTDLFFARIGPSPLRRPRSASSFLAMQTQLERWKFAPLARLRHSLKKSGRGPLGGAGREKFPGCRWFVAPNPIK